MQMIRYVRSTISHSTTWWIPHRMWYVTIATMFNLEKSKFFVIPSHIVFFSGVGALLCHPLIEIGLVSQSQLNNWQFIGFSFWCICSQLNERSIRFSIRTGQLYAAFQWVLHFDRIWFAFNLYIGSMSYFRDRRATRERAEYEMWMKERREGDRRDRERMVKKV